MGFYAAASVTGTRITLDPQILAVTTVVVVVGLALVPALVPDRTMIHHHHILLALKIPKQVVNCLRVIQQGKPQDQDGLTLVLVDEVLHLLLVPLLVRVASHWLNGSGGGWLHPHHPLHILRRGTVESMRSIGRWTMVVGGVKISTVNRRTIGSVARMGLTPLIIIATIMI